MFCPFSFLPSLPATSQHEVRATGQRLIKRKKRLLRGQAKIKTMQPAVTKDSTAGKHSLCMLSRFPSPLQSFTLSAACLPSQHQQRAFHLCISNVPYIAVSATCLPSQYQQRAFHRCISNVPSISVSATCLLSLYQQRAFHRCISNVPSISVSATCQLHATRQSLDTRQVDRQAKEDP